ncbi:hypothetical protein UFOVP908_150 [uncultured Caudovirales phage]|uniref:Uncharacterized protein n=1 Tax=uncultured Caudovirales phage TaxID=2100421 RepID=A0A6J5T8K9_9CAUD|nr:hypothetical protein UFOVP908_150 [uncultured Caudovirales phage]CAB4177168.1 hypothetical protein UFOVP990_219 [uncultured Caudovirales phage]CAB4181256.1 hypothetical protein UFOVP1065_17 [uncultured Caudovirales phage]CAB4190879.1 hypothetical protein UFOVP1198_219 [uncultured Caudovirales phage]CAB4211230.1 hypothetical protein UFOVP1418_211 [uncultured Caudovirales phage]
MERIESNVQTGIVSVIQFTPEEASDMLASTASLVLPVVPPAPTLGELQAQLAALTAQMAALANTGN